MTSMKATLQLLLLAAIMLSMCACAASPAPLRGEARQLVADEVARFDGPDGPSKLHGSPGVHTRGDGTKVPYDRVCLVGSELGADRGKSFQAFVNKLRSAGGDFEPLYIRDDQVESLLVNLDGERIKFTTLKW